MSTTALPPGGGLAPAHLRRAGWSLFVLLSGPGGVGKGTCIQQLLRANPDLELIASATTRDHDQRDGEGEYVYCSKQEFEELWSDGRLLEADEHMGNWYGQMSPTRDALGISDIDVDGSQRLFDAGLPQLLRIGLLPPGGTMAGMIDTCVKRMEGRGSTQKIIDKRRERAEYEIRTIQDRWPRDPNALIIVNDDLAETVDLIGQHITRQMALMGPP